MKAVFRFSLVLVIAQILNVTPSLAGVDEFLGDASIYAGVPSSKTRPNVLIIIDNSKATLNYAAGDPYRVKDDVGNFYEPYPMRDVGQAGGCIDGVENIANECYLPWNIYEIDNQGDVANQVISANDSYDLAGLNNNATCGVNDIVRKTLQKRGSYSASGTEDYPVIKNNACETAQNGAVYVLGNYLNYTLAQTDVELSEENYCEVEPTYVRYCSDFTGNGACKNNHANFFRLIPGSQPPVGSEYQPGHANGLWTNYWTHLGVDENGEPLDETGSPLWEDWSPTQTYTTTYSSPRAEGCIEYPDPNAGGGSEETGRMTQREIMYSALEAAIESAAGAVNFSAMVYNKNNSGGQLVNAMTDLSSGYPLDPNDPDKIILPDDFNCQQSGGYEDTDICKFLGALPGSGWTGTSALGVENDYPTVSSNTARPQGEAVYDAGYYFGAQYSPVALAAGTRVPSDIENECGLNHIILLTNGFTNGDSFNSGQVDTVVGDADGDNIDETVYGLGSHWMDDVAKYLQNFHGITTHTVLAFQERDELVEGTAKDGEGKFFHAYNREDLAEALLKLLASIVNDADTSFVAPVVPASTTNRTISSNKVYLGLFRPQESEPWRGNVKKYGLSQSTYQLTDANHTAASPSYATDAYGNFDRDSISYWSEINGAIPAGNELGYIDPNDVNENKAKGDGGKVDAGGTGGVLLHRIDTLASAIRGAGSWEVNPSSWRRIFSVIDPDEVLTHNNNKIMPDSTVMTNSTAGMHNEIITPEMLGVSGTSNPEADKNALILFLHGFEYDDLLVSGNAEAREWIMGDVLHSRPLVFNYDRYTEEGESLCSDATVTDTATGTTRTVKANSSMVFVGANDGMLHAFRDCDGSESWAFMPPNVLKNLKNMREPLVPGGHPTYVDAAPSLFVHDQNANGTIESATDRVILVFGQRRGGAQSATPGTYELDSATSRGAYYALDVTDPNNPDFLWEIDFNDLGEMGQTWSQPRLAKVPVDANSFKIVAFVGAGYDNNEDLRYGNTQDFVDATGVDINDAPSGGTVDGSGDALTSTDNATALAADDRKFPRGRGLLALEVATLTRANAASDYEVTANNTGTIYWSYTYADNSNLKYSFASDLTVVDMDGDSFADTIYIGDTGGNLWRFRVGQDADGDGTNEGKAEWHGNIIFTANPGADGSNGRKFFYRPSLAHVGAPHIYIGSGDREHPLNMATVDRMYCIIDWGQNTPVNENYLEDVTENLIQHKDTDPDDALERERRLYSTPSAPYNPFINTFSDYTYGWYIRLDGVDHASDVRDPNYSEVILGEKVLAQPTVFNGQVFFSTYQLITGTQAGCEAGNLGVSRLYQLDYKTGEAVMNFDVNNDLGEGETPTNERAVGGENGELLQRTDRVRILGQGIPSGIVTIIDASGRVTQLISSSDKVEASASTDVKLISPVYWMQW